MSAGFQYGSRDRKGKKKRTAVVPVVFRFDHLVSHVGDEFPTSTVSPEPTGRTAVNTLAAGYSTCCSEYSVRRNALHDIVRRSKIEIHAEPDRRGLFLDHKLGKA